MSLVIQVCLQGSLLLTWSLGWFVPFFALAFVSHLHLLHAHRSWSWAKVCLALVVLLPIYIWLTADDDIYRYLWEARVFSHGFNPYLQSPQALSSLFEGVELVNHSSWTAIYGPLFIEMVAWLPSFLQTIFGLKFIWFGFHLLNVWLIRAITSSSHFAKLYLLCPFILLESMGLGHFESILASSGLLLVYGLQRQKHIVASIGLGLGLWIKWWALPLLPLLIRKRNLKTLGLSFMLSLLVLYPFVSDISVMFHSLLDFQGLWCNGYPYAMLELIFGGWTQGILVIYGLALLVVVLLVGGSLHEQLWQFFRMSLFFAPTIHPWYWVFPLSMTLCSGKTATFAFLSACALGLHYPEFHLTQYGSWECHPLTVLPLLVSIWLSEWRIRKHLFLQFGHSVEKISIITPTLNEAENIKELGECLSLHQRHIQEWIIVDAGSTDSTVEEAQRWGAQCHSPGIKGRGPQIKAGMERATANWCLVLHADTRPPLNFFTELKRHIANIPNLDGGAFRMAYLGKAKLGPLMFLNDLKIRLLGVSFGDQSQFFRKHRLEKMGGFPDLPLMEDLELSLIWKGGAIAYIKSSISFTSPRRWQNDGRLKNGALIIKLLIIYLVSRHWKNPVDVTKLYQTYYKK